MPQDTARACLACKGTVVPGTSTNPNYHDSCNPRPEARREQDRKRWVEDKAIRALYNSEHWKRLRIWVLQTKHPLCNICHRNPSTVADHINDHKGNHILFYSQNNLQGLCKRCHDIKTGRTNGFGSDRQDMAEKTSIQVNGVNYPLAGSSAAEQSVDNRQVAGSNPARPTIPFSPPPLIPVKPEHLALPDGRVANKEEFSRWYVKRGSRWFILPPNFNYDTDTENGMIKCTSNTQSRNA